MQIFLCVLFLGFLLFLCLIALACLVIVGLADAAWHRRYP